MLPTALQLYSVRDFLEKDYEGTIAEVKKMGYDGVEFAGLSGKAPLEVKALLEKHGLEPLSAHVSYEDLMKDPVAVLKDYSTVGCKYISIPYLMEEYRPGAPKYNIFVEDAKMLGAKAKVLGMTLLYHNHDFEFEKVNGRYMLDIIYESVTADLLQTQIDTCWVRVAGIDPAEYVRKYTGRAPVVHLKDFVKEGEGDKLYDLIGVEDNRESASTFEFRPVGQGVQDMPAIVKAAVDAGAKWVVVEQDQPTAGKSSMQCAMESINYLKTI